METRNKTLTEIITFLVLTILLSALVYIPIIQSGTIQGEQSKLAGFLMLAPGLAAIITYLIFERSLRPVGWGIGNGFYLLLALVIPIVYCLAEYGVAWLTGGGRYNGQIPPNFVVYLGTMLYNGTTTAIFEEVGWRGFLVPKMIKMTNFTLTALITGLIWAVWHYPLIIFTDIQVSYAPLLYSLACFTIFTVGMSFATAWLRLKSGSIWTAALLHGSHNVFMLYVFNVLTTDTGSSWMLLGEYGALTAGVGLILAILFWALRTKLPVSS